MLVLAACCALPMVLIGAPAYPVSWGHATLVTLVGVTVAGSLRAVTRELGTLAQRFAQEAVVDDLTGLLNRRGWRYTAPRELARAARSGNPITLVTLDLDNFKELNDELGHEQGDHALRDTAERIRATLRAGDVVARLGGDEFVALLTNSTLTGSVAAIDRLRDATPEREAFSSGIAVWDRKEDLAELLRRSDLALYAAKEAGGGRTSVAPPHLEPLPEEPWFTIRVRGEDDDAEESTSARRARSGELGRGLGDSRIARSRRRSLRVARRTAIASRGPSRPMSPVAPPRLRKVIRVVRLVHGGPGVCGLHRERPVDGAHHQPCLWFELDGSVDVREPAAHEPGDEGHLGADPERRLGLPARRTRCSRTTRARCPGRPRRRRPRAGGRAIVISVRTSTATAAAPRGSRSGRGRDPGPRQRPRADRGTWSSRRRGAGVPARRGRGGRVAASCPRRPP